MGFPGSSVVKNPPTNAFDVRLILRLEGSPGRENGSLGWKDPLVEKMVTHWLPEQSHGQGAWQATVCGVTESWT